MRLVHQVAINGGDSPDQRLDGAPADRARRQIWGAERHGVGCASRRGHVDDPRDADEGSKPDVEALAQESPRTAASRQSDQMAIFRPALRRVRERLSDPFPAEKLTVQ